MLSAVLTASSGNRRERGCPPTPELEPKGPFATVASADYMGSYFGVSAQDSVNTGFRVDAFDPDGGFKSVGVKGLARYQFRPTWFLDAKASYSKLVGDAADSPIVKFGTEDQFTFGLSVSKGSRSTCFMPV